MSSRRTFEKAAALQNAGRTDEAIALLRHHLKRDEDPDLLALLGGLLGGTGQLTQSEYYIRKAADAMPWNPEPLAALGTVLMALGKHAEAIEPLRRSVAAGPLNEDARVSLIKSLGVVGRLAEAAAEGRAAAEALPGSARVLAQHAAALHETGRVEEALATLRKAAEIEPFDVAIADQLCAMMTYAPGIEPADAARAFRHYGVAAERAAGPAFAWDPAQVRRMRAPGPLRVAILSPDLRRHAMAFFLEPFLEHADRSRVWVACYSAAGREDEVSERLRSRADLWRNVQAMGAARAAAVIREDRIDVLIDAAGHTGSHRLDVLARGAAPVQMTYLGFPNTTGLTRVGWRLVDSRTDPEGSEPYNTERLLRMDPCLLTYRAPPLPDLAPPPVESTGRTCFGSFTSLLKLNDPLIALWTRVLLAVPGSRLLLKHTGLRDAEIRREVAERFERAGAPAGSVECEPPGEGAKAILPVYNRVDISLDTYPYNGTTTICESLLMGVPLVSLRGRTSAGRMGLSLLSAVGLEDLCAHDEDGFVRIAAAIANDRAHLASLRASLRGRFLASPAGDCKAGAARLTDAVVHAWESFLSGT